MQQPRSSPRRVRAHQSAFVVQSGETHIDLFEFIEIRHIPHWRRSVFSDLSADEFEWIRPRGFHHLTSMIADVRFINGVDVKETGGRAAGFGTGMHQIWP